jgi:hypothetical protein
MQAAGPRETGSERPSWAAGPLLQLSDCIHCRRRTMWAKIKWKLGHGDDHYEWARNETSEK